MVPSVYSSVGHNCDVKEDKSSEKNYIIEKLRWLPFCTSCDGKGGPLEISHITGYSQPKRQIQRLNQLGIAFIPPNGNTKHPIVRRDYSNKKARKSSVASEQKARVVWRSNVLNQGG